jgi:predicted nucleotidyltransferase/uncharacterized protein (UPF0332 family)
MGVEELPERQEGVKSVLKEKKKVKENSQDTLKIISERDIAVDFATKTYKKFNEMIKSIVLFGSSAKKTATSSSDIDIIIVIDDVSIKWDLELVAWYREELGKIVKSNPYRKELHINTVKLSTWWEDLNRGDPVVLNVIRFGDPLIDFGGFFTPLKVLLQQGKIKSTPEAVYTLLQRAPTHMARTRASMLAAIDGLYWAMVDSAHALIIAMNMQPPSPEHIPEILKSQFVDTKVIKMKYVEWYRDLHFLAKDIVHGKTIGVSGKDIDLWIERVDEFVRVMAELIDELTKN